ncbi:MAG TPA: hypothetical protein PLH92_17075 [Mycobacterium sp.]|nr:hypothetical protein [Mycobacterium sp.]
MFNRRQRPTALNRSVLISLTSGNALSGVCTYDGREALVLRGVTVHEPSSEPTPADGEVLVDRINVDFIQLL